jgi:hypothetical protein
MKAMKVLVVLMLMVFSYGAVNAQVHHITKRHYKKRHVIVKRHVVVVKHHR